MTLLETERDSTFEDGERSTRWRLGGRPTGFRAFTVLVGVLLTLLAIGPLLRVGVSLFWTDHHLSLAPLSAIWREPGIGKVILNTLLILVASGAIALVFGSVLAWTVERTDARMGSLSELLPLAPFFLPPVAGAVGWVLLLSDRAGLLNAFIRWVLSGVGIHLERGPINIATWYGLVFVYALYMIPYVYVMVASGLRNMDPALEEQARMSGASTVRVIRTVTLPSLRPSLGGALLFVVWLGLALYSVPSILGLTAGIEVLSVRIVNLTNDFPPRTASAVGLSLVILAIIGSTYILQRRLLSSGRHSTVGGKGHRVSRVRLGRMRWVVRGALLSYIFVSLVLPVVGLLLVTLNGFWSPRVKWRQLSLHRINSVLADANFKASITNSLKLALVGATIGAICAALLAVYVRRSSGAVSRTIDAGIKLPAVFGGVIVAVGFVLAFSGPPFNLRGTNTILLLGYLALYLPQGSVAADASAAQVGRELPEASAVSGGGDGRTFFRVYLPIMMPGLVAAWSLMFARMIGDLTISAVLSGPSNRVVSRQILDAYTAGSFADVAALALIITLITSIVVLIAMFVTRRRASTSVAAGAL